MEISIFLLLDITTTTISHIKLVKLDHISSILKQDIQKPLFDAVSVFTDNSTYGDMYSTALTNTKSIDEAQELLAKLNKKFKQNAVAFYIVKEGEKEIYYVPDSLKDVLQVKDKKKYNLNYDIVSEIRVIGE